MSRDRRHFPRISIMGLIHVALPGDNRTREAYVTNISEGGVGLYLHQALEVGDEIVVHLSAKTRKKGTILSLEVPSRVMWVKPMGRMHQAGVLFLKLSPTRYRDVMRAYGADEDGNTAFSSELDAEDDEGSGRLS